MILVKIHRNPNGQKIIALCDKELLNKKFEEGNQQLDLTTDFYNGEEKSEEEIKQLIKDVYIINLIGKESLQFVENLKLHPEQIITVQGIPHAEIVLVRE